MRVYPLNLLIDSKPCAVIGGGEVAARKIKGLLDAGAEVTVISPEICPEIERLALNEDKGFKSERSEDPYGPLVSLVRREYRSGDLAGMMIVVAATGDDAVNSKVALDARSSGILVNVSDRPDDCDFFLPAVLRRGDVTVAVGTGGDSPKLAGKLRDKLKMSVGGEYGEMAAILGKLRRQISRDGEDLAANSEIFDKLIDSDLAKCLKRKDYPAAAEIIEKIAGKKIKIDNLENE